MNYSLHSSNHLHPHSLNIPDHDLSYTSSASYSDVYHKLIAPALGSCPTKNYIVVLQPSVSTSDYDRESATPFLSGLANSQNGRKISRVTGQVNDNWTINTILMDCLHHGVTRVEEVVIREDEKYEKYWGLDADREMIGKSVMFVRLLPAQKSRPEVQIKNSDILVEGMVHRWFGAEDYTLIWITEARGEGEGEVLGEIIEEGQKALIGE